MSWLSPYDGSGEITVCEGVEDGLSLVEAGAANAVAAILGIGRLGKVRWPWGARKLLIARDDDTPGSHCRAMRCIAPSFANAAKACRPTYCPDRGR